MKMFVIITFIITIIQSAFADEYSSNYWVGIVRNIRGNAMIGERLLSINDRIFRNEIIKTSKKSLAVIELMDKTEIKLGPESEFRVDKWIYYNDHDRDSSMSILRGQIRAHVKSKTRYGEQVEFKTKNISMGIRGTEFLVNVVEELESEVTQIALIKGLIHLRGHELVDNKFMYPGDEINFIKDDKRQIFETKKFDNEYFIKNENEFLSLIAFRANNLEENVKIVKDNLENPSSRQGKSVKNLIQKLNEVRVQN